MAKKQASATPPPGVVKDKETQVVENKTETIELQETTVHSITAGKITVDVPVMLMVNGYVTRNLRSDVRMTHQQAMGWRSVLQGLEQQDAKLTNGKYVANTADAVRWMGEQVFKSLP